MIKLKLIDIGSATGVVLPEEMLRNLEVGEGDLMCAIETSEGYLITRCGQSLPHQLESGHEFMEAYRDTLKALAD